MFWYLVICGLFLIISITTNIAGKNYDTRKYGLINMLFVLWFFASFRSIYVGADTKQNLALFDQLRNMNLSQVIHSSIYGWNYRYTVNWELGYKLLIFVYLKAFFFFSTRTALGFISLLLFWFLYKLIIQQSSFPLLSVWLYLTLGFFQTGLNMMQNALSIVICLWAIKFIKEGKPLKWCVSILFGTLIHNSALIFLPMYWIASIRFTRKVIPWLLLAYVVLALGSSRVIRLLEYIVPIGYRGYMHYSSSIGSSMLVIVLHFSLLLPIVLLQIMSATYTGNELNMKEKIIQQPYFTFFVAEIGLYILAITSAGFLRVATIFSPALVLYIPNVVNTIEEEKNKRVIIVMIILISILGYILRMSMNNIGSTQPYSFYQ